MFVGRPFTKRFALCYRTVVLSVCLDVTLVYCGQTVGYIKMPFGMEIGLGHGYIVLDWPSPRPQQRGTAPQFSTHVCCRQSAGYIKMSLGREVGLGSGDIGLDGDPAPSPLPKKGAQPPNFRPMSVVAKRLHGLGCHFGMEVGLDPGHIVLYVDPAPCPPLQKKWGTAPNFRPMSVMAKRLDGSGCHLVEVGLGPGHIVLDGYPTPPVWKRAQQPPLSWFSDAGSFACVRVNRGARQTVSAMGHDSGLLGTEVGLSPGDTALHVGPSSSNGKEHNCPPQLFGACLSLL